MFPAAPMPFVSALFIPLANLSPQGSGWVAGLSAYYGRLISGSFPQR
jgi:hypothetical protein